MSAWLLPLVTAMITADADAPTPGPCPECGSEDGHGYVNYGCIRGDCPGCDRCDIPCLTCNTRGRVR